MNHQLASAARRGPRALLIAVALLSLLVSQAASAASMNLHAFLMPHAAGPLAIGAAQLVYDPASDTLSIDTTALGISLLTLPQPYWLHLSDRAMSLGSSEDWRSLPGRVRGIGSHIEINPCAGDVDQSCRAHLMDELVNGATLSLSEGRGLDIAGSLEVSETPEPGSGVLAAVGLVGLAAFGRRHR